MINKCIEYINNSPTSFHAVKTLEEKLKAEGFLPLAHGENLEAGQGYFTKRNDSALIAFRVPPKPLQRILISSAHTDSPCFRVRDNAEIKGKYSTLSVERYGGAINATWIDRPLSIAGRVLVRAEDGLKSLLVNLEEDACVIPNVAIHLNRELNDKPGYNLAKDYFPLYASADSEDALKKDIAEKLGVNAEDIVGQDLFLYNNQKGTRWGHEKEFVSSPRLDDLACVITCAEAFLAADNEDSLTVLCAFDHEEIGSGTFPGAESDFLPTLLDEICDSLGVIGGAKSAVFANSMMLSCDNAHALHPNHPEMSDSNEAPVLNGGVVVKHSPHYTTNGVSSAVVTELCKRNEIPVQHYSNRPDKPGGSTLGNIAITKTGMLAADIGIPQLAMHSAFETCGAKDIDYFEKAVEAFYMMKLNLGEGKISF